MFNWNQRRAMILNQQRAFSPADEGSPSPAPAPAAPEGGSDQSEGDPPAPDPSSSILDLAKAPGGEPKTEGEGDAYAAPDYIPEHLRGADGADTMKKVFDAYRGARKSLSQGGKLEGAVPDKPDGYSFEDTGTDDEPDKVFAELTSEASKPVVDMARAAAHKAGIPDKAFDGFMRDFVAGAAEGGLPIGVDVEEAQQISAEAEMERLTELVGSGNEASTVVNTVSTYAQKLVDRGTITKEDLSEFGIMVGTADSAHLFYRIMTAELGERPIPAAQGGPGQVSQTDAYALHAKASSMPEGSEKDQAMSEANEAIQKAFGNNPSGSVRSNVL